MDQRQKFSKSNYLKRNPIVEADLAQITCADLPWAELEGRNVLVTGANGFVPAYLAEALLYLNENKLTKPLRLLALVRNREKAEARFSAYHGRADLQIIVQDVCSPVEVDVPIHYIIHAASQASPKYYGVDPAGTIAPNVIGTFHLLELARKSRALGFLFVSSGEVYGKFPASFSKPVTEDDYGTLDPLDLRACYGEGKRAGETMCRAWSHQFGVPAKIARLGHTYGPGMDLTDGRVFADFVANVVRGENIIMKSDGSAMRPFCYLTDAATGLLTVLLKGNSGTAYNVVNDEAEITILELANLLCGLFPEKGIRAIRPPVGEPVGVTSWNPGARVDTSKVRVLGWRPTISPEAGFRRTVGFYDGLKARVASEAEDVFHIRR